MADIGTFSFQATKTITTGEGGMVITKRVKIQISTKTFRNHGIKSTRYMHIVPGHNFRLTNLQASIGYSQIKNFNKIIKDRKKL